MVANILVSFFVTAGMLFLLSKLFKGEFVLNKESWIMATIVLVLTQWLLGFLLSIPKGIANILTLGLLTFIVNWLANSFIFWVADKFSKDITIKTFRMIFIGGAALSLSNWASSYIITKFFS